MTIYCRKLKKNQKRLEMTDNILLLCRFSWVLVATTIRQTVASIVEDAATASATTSVSDETGMSQPPNHQRPPRPAPPESTVVATIDVLSVVQVDSEDAPELLATGRKWEQAKKAQL
jgi:hypothetical protein